MRAAGLTPEDYADEVFEVWPENWRAFELFSYMQTQWRVGMSGATGLDYRVMQHKMDRMKLAPDEYEQLEADMQVMEMAAMSEMNKKT